MAPEVTAEGYPRLDSIVTIVDALRLKDEFGSGNDLLKQNLEEDDIENLVIQQIEFCNIVLLNKAADVEPKELGRIREIIRTLQPKAEIIDCNYGDVDLDKIIDTHMFDFNKVATSAAWIAEIEGHVDDDDDDDHDHDDYHHDYDDDDDHDHEHHDHDHHDDDHDDDHEHEHHHGHHHHHHHDHEGGEVEEYGIGTYVYYRRPAFDLGLFDEFVARKWPKNIIRAKGICYFDDEKQTCYVFEQAGKQVSLRNAGQWYATMPKNQLAQFLQQNPGVMRDWDVKYGDRMQKLVFIGQHLDKKEIERLLDECLA
jgi:G3E family GTPase